MCNCNLEDSGNVYIPREEEIPSGLLPLQLPEEAAQGTWISLEILQKV